HNYELFPDYIAQVESRTKEARARIKEEPSDKELKAEHMRALNYIQQLKRWQGGYAKVFDQFFRIAE
nr:hypothetical protein [Candidatus Sigynarchaeum springense]